jgi:hypothetical protein
VDQLVSPAYVAGVTPLTGSSYFVTQCSTIFLWGQALAFFEQKVPLIMGEW